MDSKLQKDKRLRFGIMGAANIAKKNAIAIVTSDSCEFAAIASRDRAKAEAFLTNNGLSSSNAKVYTSYEDLLADDSIDAVYIPVSPISEGVLETRAHSVSTALLPASRLNRHRCRNRILCFVLLSYLYSSFPILILHEYSNNNRRSRHSCPHCCI